MKSEDSQRCNQPLALQVTMAVLTATFRVEILIADTDKIRLSSFGGVNRIGDKSKLFSAVLIILETEQLCPVLSAA